jgi:UDP-N-acetylmuramoyl-tripeptide--D-alanyl-D-alanine ligase
LENFETFLTIEKFITHTIFVISLGFYLITNLQWYHYKIERVLTKHHKISWHFLYFLLPIVAYYISGSYFAIFFYFGYLPYLYLWNKKLDKKLVFTARVKRFFATLIFMTFFQNMLCLAKESCSDYGILMPIFVTFAGTFAIEKMIFFSYYQRAKKRLSEMPDMKIIAITGSYGKTSIKNFLAQILAYRYRVYATPKSVNTLEGIVKDINENLDRGTEIYIVEAGAREIGDIRKIANLVNHNIGIVGKIGEQHIEYFKKIENIISTKLEIVYSKNIQKLYLHSSINENKVQIEGANFEIEAFGESGKDTISDLKGTFFELNINGKVEEFSSPVLGSFQSENLEVVIKVAHDLGISIPEIKILLRTLKPVPHRLEILKAGGKTIIDDGYNGNLEGMLEAFRLVETFEGRKVIVTPGLVESSEEQNERVAFEIDDIFDVVIITGSLNRDFFKRKLVSIKPTRIFLEDKSKLEEVLLKETKSGDIILFANDAPNFI